MSSPDVPLAPKHTGFKVSADGLLSRIRDGKSLRRGDKNAKGTRFMVGEMLRHLEKMATRFYAGDLQVVDEFLQLYDLDQNRPQQEPGPPGPDRE